MERFDHFMDRCLYGHGGFYATDGTAGRRRGDFITSPEVGPLFGAVIAEALDRWWERSGKPDPFTIYDVGCGPGTLLRAIRVARPDRPWNLIGVDLAAPTADLTELPEDLSGAVVIANELLDNLPFRIVQHDPDGFVEVFVTQDDGAKPREILKETELRPDISVGSRAPILDAAANWVGEALSRNPAVVCLFDYGTLTTAELAARGGWLRTYRAHQRGEDPFVDPGSRDITTDVAWDQLPPPTSLTRQAEFLQGWSIDRLVEEGRSYWVEHAHSPDLVAFRMRSRISEAEALLDPSGLGQWWAATWSQIKEAN